MFGCRGQGRHGASRSRNVPCEVERARGEGVHSCYVAHWLELAVRSCVAVDGLSSLLHVLIVVNFDSFCAECIWVHTDAHSHQGWHGF